MVKRVAWLGAISLVLGGAALSEPASAADPGFPTLQPEFPNVGYDVVAIAENMNGDQAAAYLSKLPDTDLAFAAGTGLAGVYQAGERHEDALRIFRWLIRERPDDPSASSFMRRISVSERSLGRLDEAWAATLQHLKTYGPGTEWYAAQSQSLDRREQDLAALEEELRTVAQELEHIGRSRRSSVLLDKAGQAYRQYLRSFPESPYLYHMRFSYAALLVDLTQLADAYDQYNKVVQMVPLGKYAEPSAKRTVEIAQTMAVQERGKVGRPKAGSSVSTKLIPWEHRLVTAVTVYLDLYPESEREIELRFQVGKLFHDLNQYEKATRWLAGIVERDPSHEVSPEAARMLLDGLARGRRWREAQTYGAQFVTMSKLGDSTFRSQLSGVIEQAAYETVAVEYPEAASDRAAGDAWMRFYEQFPDGELAKQALENAAERYEQGGVAGKARKARKTKTKRFGV